MKERVKSVLNYKKPAFWIILVALAACIALSVCLLTDPIRLSDPMKVFIDGQLTDYHSSDKNEGTGFLDYEVLDIDRSGRETTVYMWVLWEEYQCVGGALQANSGSHMFTVMTVRENDSGYELIELWLPRDGTYWASDIRDKVPWYLYSRAVDSQRYIKEQKENVVRMAEEYFGLAEPTVALGNTLLKKMEDLTLNSTFRNTIQIMVEYGGAYKVNLSFSSSDVVALGNLEISAERVSDSLSETRDKTHTIVLQTAEDLDPMMSNVPGLALHFNEDFTQVWAGGSLVKPTHSYKVADPQKARALFEKLAESSQSLVGGVSGPENVTGTQEPTLREMFPRYFDLPVDKGLQVYVWQMAHSQFYCGLLPGRNFGYTQEEIEALKPATVNQMRQIVASYNLSKDKVSVIPINHSLSSYYYTIDDAYIERVTNLFWWGVFYADGSLLSPVLDEVRCDLDGDGNEETVTLLPGPTSGLLTYTIAVSWNSALTSEEPSKSSIVFYPSGDSGWESDFSLEKTEDGRCMLKGLSGEEQKEVYYSITCSDGQIVCSKLQE